MIVSHEHKFVFIKPRKTAGSSLEALLFPYLNLETDVCTGSPRDGTPRLNTPTEDGHVAAWQIKDIPKDYFWFTIERNPWDKMVSAYWWHKKTKPDWSWTKDFESYVHCPYIPKDWEKYSHDSKIIVNKVYRYEDMAFMYNQLNNRFNFNITEEQYTNTRMKSGVRKSGHYSELYNDSTKHIVSKKFKQEIYTLGYDYGEG